MAFRDDILQDERRRRARHQAGMALGRRPVGRRLRGLIAGLPVSWRLGSGPPLFHQITLAA
jgi:hypothetical protein